MPLKNFVKKTLSVLLKPLGSFTTDEPVKRSQYKIVWNARTDTEDGAKLAVAGYTDEGQLAATAEMFLTLLKQTVGIQPTDRVLEIGAGVGRLGRVIAPLCAEWIGADVSENMLQHIRHRLSDLPNVQTIALSGFDLSPIPSGSLDLVYSTVVFMHLEEWDRYNYIREGLRVLKPGGRMLVDNVNLLTDEGWAFFEDHLRIPPQERPPQISQTSTPQELEAYFRRAGFEQIEQMNCWLWLLTWGRKPMDE